MGKVLMAGLSEDEFRATLDGGQFSRLTEQTIDSDRFTRQHAETLPVAEPPDVQNAVALVRSILLDDTAP
jgi:hypothetical protein